MEIKVSGRCQEGVRYFFVFCGFCLYSDFTIHLIRFAHSIRPTLMAEGSCGRPSVKGVFSTKVDCFCGAWCVQSEAVYL